MICLKSQSLLSGKKYKKIFQNVVCWKFDPACLSLICLFDTSNLCIFPYSISVDTYLFEELSTPSKPSKPSLNIHRPGFQLANFSHSLNSLAFPLPEGSIKKSKYFWFNICFYKKNNIGTSLINLYHTGLSADDNWWHFSYFPRKQDLRFHANRIWHFKQELIFQTGFDILCKLSPLEIICMKCGHVF